MHLTPSDGLLFKQTMTEKANIMENMETKNGVPEGAVSSGNVGAVLAPAFPVIYISKRVVDVSATNGNLRYEINTRFFP